MAIRVYQIAKEYSKKPDDIIRILNDAGISVASHTSALDEHALHTIRAKFGKFKLTVVDGDQESPVGDEKKVAAKPAKGKKKKADKPKPEAPKLAVRVIKKNEDEKKPEVEEPPVEEAKPKRPKLRRPKRISNLEERIQARAAKQATDDTPSEEAASHAPEAPADSTPAASTESAPAATPAPAAQQGDEGDDKKDRKTKKRAEKSISLESLMPEGSRPTQNRGPRQYSRDGRPGDRQGRPGDRQGGDRQGRPGDRQGRPGDRQGRPGDRQGGRPGDRQGRPGDRQGGRPGGPGGRPGGPGARPGGPGGRPGDRQGGRPGGPGGRPGGPGGRPGGPGGRPGGRPGGPGGPGSMPPPGFQPGPNPEKSGGMRPRYGMNKPGKKKKKKRRNQEQPEKMRVITASRVELPTEDLGIIMLSEGVTVKELAEKVERKSKDIIKRLFEKGIMATLNDVLDSELAIEIAKDFGYLAEIVSFEEDLQIQEDENFSSDEADDGEAETRSPIVTIMGHVDHGKTTLLDAIREARVASGEAGGITQHIGAYAVPCKDQEIVFLDTPGHEAFTKMRARGASVTDIVVLVVAADDGVKPQTIEAISHAKAAKVPIITCINKIDKPDANPDRVKQMLTEHELIVEDYGGDSPSVEVSAKQKIGINDLLEMIILVAELQDYKAKPNRKARGTVIEARLDRGRGPVATLIVQDGSLNVGDVFITGQTYGKIRAMHDDIGGTITGAGPSTPVEVLGIQDVPAAGDSFQVVADEAEARKISSFRKEKAREELHRKKHTSLDQLFSNLKESETKELSIIIKADVQGSVEGLVFALDKIESEKVNLRFVLQGVGNITENDILLAAASDAIVIGFNVKAEPKAQSLADQEGIEIRNYSIIYEVVKQIEAAMLGLVAPTLEERTLGKASVKQVFSVSRLGKVAGCYVEDGVVKRDAHVRVNRGGKELFTGQLQTLKRFKDDVNEVKSGYECGIGIQGYSDLEEGDLLVFFTFDEVHATEL